MTADPNPYATPPKFQFRVLTLLIVITAACVLLGFLPRSLSPATRITIFAYVAFVADVAALAIYRAKQREINPPKETGDGARGMIRSMPPTPWRPTGGFLASRGDKN